MLGCMPPILTRRDSGVGSAQGLCPAAKRWDHGFPDDGHLKSQFGHKSAEGEEEDEDDE